ncbi:hypothetical protein NADFUDRAFT_42309 [Nadsonia fulvescens var. elongata DSM 6958]|uniref:Arrestin C-terminal-like domain-containing protein n=1 Tax=Nadsonia fulvescens var. elongata DSM 6958 TaxID=857566 RepID=A0A1E3PI16_9ASCO|nr:hypothetical protein NADFUDRAFT_42309 [Nadsonia fulvescens var. elongata DSM 6958]
MKTSPILATSPPSYSKINSPSDPACGHDLKLYHAVVGPRLKKVSSPKLDSQIQVFLSIQEPTIYMPQLSIEYLDLRQRSLHQLQSQKLKGCVVIKVLAPTKLKQIALKLQQHTSISTANETYKNSGSLLWDFQTAKSKPDIHYDYSRHECHKHKDISLSEVNIPVFDPYRDKTVSRESSSQLNNDPILQPGEYLYNFIASVPDTIPESASTYKSKCEYSISLKVTKPRSFSSSLFSILVNHTVPIKIVRTPSSTCHDTSESLSYTPAYAIDSGLRNWKDMLQYSVTVPRPYIMLGERVTFDIGLYPQEKMKVSTICVYWNQSIRYFKQLNHSSSPQISEAYNGNLESKISQTVARLGNEMPKKKLLFSHKAEDYNGTDNYLAVGSTSPTNLNLEADFICKGPAGNSNEYGVNKPFYASTFSPFNCLQVTNKIQVELDVSFMDDEKTSSSKLRKFKIQLEIPVEIFSESCSTETLELPQYGREFQLGHSISNSNTGGLSEILPAYHRDYDYNNFPEPLDSFHFRHDLVLVRSHGSVVLSTISSKIAPPEMSLDLVPTLSYDSVSSLSTASSAETLFDDSPKLGSHDISIATPRSLLTNHHGSYTAEEVDSSEMGRHANFKPLKSFSLM